MKTLKITLVTLLIAFLPSLISFSQVPPPPPPGDDPCNTGGTQVGGPNNAPIGNGAGVLVLMAVAYGLLKYRMRREDED